MSTALATVGILAPSPLWSQATPQSAGIAQPHLAKARALAFQENNWKFPALIACYPDEGQPAQKIIADPGPTKAADNLYFLGNGIVAAWALDTPDGIILIDAMNNQKEVDKYIIGGLTALGIDPARIKVLLISHGHLDHFGGGRYLKERFGVRVYEPALDAQFAAASWKPGDPDRPQPPDPDVLVKDGDSLRFGGVEIKLFVTAGHTPGGLSMLIPVRDKGQPRLLAYYGGITSKNLSPEMHAAYDESIGRFARISEDARVDGYIANHPSYDDAAGKLAKIRSDPQKPNPFMVGTAGTVRFLSVLRECNLNNIDIERAAPRQPRS
jgi:metallo-beta-lactamase class B